MLDQLSDTVFWPLFVLVVLLACAAFGWGIEAIIRWTDNPKNRYITRDPHDERRERVAHNGFKSRMGVK